MKQRHHKKVFYNDYAVTEIVGTIILILVAVVSFSVISMYLIPENPDMQTFVKIVADVTDDGKIILYHKGGVTLTDYNIFVRNYTDGGLIGSGEVVDDNWKIDSYRYPLELINVDNVTLINDTDMIKLEIYNTNKDGSQEQVFNGILSGTNHFSLPVLSYQELMLISSLRTNTTDEDLICFADTNTSINATTYIYTWLLNGYPYAQFLMPFNTNDSNVAKDYSGNGYDGLVRECIWVPNGVVGGAYRFGGSKEYVVIEANLPDCFNDTYRNSFSISIWVSCHQLDDDNRIIMEIRRDTQNFVRLFQDEDAFQFGVCVDNVKYSVKTTEVQGNTWYHLAAVWKPKDGYLAVYINGEKCDESGSTTFSCGAHTGISLGHGNSGSGGYWYGLLDEVQIYDRVLSEEQILQIYTSQKTGLTNKEIIVSEELNRGEIWQCIVTPNDGVQDGIPVASNLLQLINYGGG
jgi:hypothetical protein